MKAPRYQHLAFHQLNSGEDFFYRKYRYYKSSFWTGRMILDGDLVIVMPWTKVRSTRVFGKPTVSHSVSVCKATVERTPFVTFVGASAGLGAPTPAILKLREELIREPQTVTPGGDRTPETIGGNEKCPSA